MGGTNSSNAEPKKCNPDTKAGVLNKISKDLPNFIYKDKDWTILHYAVFEGRDKLVKRILSVAPEMIDQKTNDGKTALDIAFEGRKEKVVLQLFKLYPSQMDTLLNLFKRGYTVLHHAAEKGLDTVVAHILAVKPQMINTVTSEKKTPLHCAASGANFEGNLAVATRLLAASPALAHAFDDRDRSALHYAASAGNVPVAKFLMAASPVLIHAVDHRNWTVLHAAALLGRNAMAEYLLARRPELIRSCDLSGKTALHVAALHGQSAMVEYLLSVSPALIDTVDRHGQTPLHSAALFLPVVQILLAIKPELMFVKDMQENTVLHMAVRVYESFYKPSKELIEELWRLHPEALRAVNHNGRTPFHVAVEQDNDVAIEVF